MTTPELNLIVAATRSMGIGNKGGLPWTGLRKEMAYFARVTKYVPAGTAPGAFNAVIMGRKTWESIPTRFQPLKDRLNVVISRSYSAPQPNSSDSANHVRNPVQAPSLESALAYLSALPASQLARVFVIGGGQIYAAALQIPSATRVLLTQIRSEFECDTRFPLVFGEGGDSGWVRASDYDWEMWTGGESARGVQEENGIDYEYQMWEKV
ncbi:hypothetical protein Cpir12675_005257 [Ceratocystis pirilliformis]|uniref:Dihydrofolate reductase n=1 Tax=Ceratocystis pirilliformis TaxID=259994 RepID=A0ABR3YRY7_9PEZI